MEETKEARKSEDRLRFLEFHPTAGCGKFGKNIGKGGCLLFSIWPVLASILDFRELWMISYPLFSLRINKKGAEDNEVFLVKVIVFSCL